MSTLPKRNIVVRGILLSIVLIVISLLLPALIYSHANSYSGLEKAFFLSRLLLWASVLMLYFFAIKFERQPLLHKEERHSFLFHVVSVLALIIIIFITALLVSMILKLTGLTSVRSERYLLLLKVFHYNTPLMLFGVFTAGVAEELVFRGYVLTRLQVLFKNSYLPVIISSVIFGLIHFGYGTIQNILVPMFIGAVFAVYYNRYKNILIVIIAHFLYDLLLVLLTLHFYYPH